MGEPKEVEVGPIEFESIWNRVALVGRYGVSRADGRANIYDVDTHTVYVLRSRPASEEGG